MTDDMMMSRAEKLERLTAERDALRAQVERLETALRKLQAALKADSRKQTILSDTVEYHLDGPAMYHAINEIRGALAGPPDPYADFPSARNKPRSDCEHADCNTPVEDHVRP